MRHGISPMDFAACHFEGTGLRGQTISLSCPVSACGNSVPFWHPPPELPKSLIKRRLCWARLTLVRHSGLVLTCATQSISATGTPKSCAEHRIFRPDGSEFANLGEPIITINHSIIAIRGGAMHRPISLAIDSSSADRLPRTRGEACTRSLPTRSSVHERHARAAHADCRHYSYRKISTGKIREAARAGISVAAALMARAAAAIHIPSSALVWNGT